MSERKPGDRCRYTCSICGRVEWSKPIEPPPALSVFGLPSGWIVVPTALGVPADDLHCDKCVCETRPPASCDMCPAPWTFLVTKDGQTKTNGGRIIKHVVARRCARHRRSPAAMSANETETEGKEGDA